MPCLFVPSSDRAQLLELYVSRTVTEVDPSTYMYIANASFAATSGRGMDNVADFYTFAHSVLSDTDTRTSFT